MDDTISRPFNKRARTESVDVKWIGRGIVFGVMLAGAAALRAGAGDRPTEPEPLPPPVAERTVAWPTPSRPDAKADPALASPPVPWYRVEADWQAVPRHAFRRGLRLPEGTVDARMGYARAWRRGDVLPLFTDLPEGVDLMVDFADPGTADAPPPGAADALPMDIYFVSEREAGDGAATPERARFTAGRYYVFCYGEKLVDAYAGRTHPPQPPRIRTPYTLSALIAVVEIVPTATPLTRADAAPVPFATADYGQTPPMPNAVPMPAATYDVLWYTVDADFYTMRTAYGWQHLPLPVGTAEAHRGRAGMIGWSETHGSLHASLGAVGMHFYPEGLDGVAAPVDDPNGPGVRLAQFRRPETKDDERKRYVSGRAYVFCFDRPLATAIPPRPATPGAPADTVELAQALPFLMGVVEVRPTFELAERAPTAPLADLTMSSFRSFGWRLYGGATFDFTWTQDADGERTTRLHAVPHRADARERPFTEDQRDRLVYLLGAAPWEPTRAIGRPPTNTYPAHNLTYMAADGRPASAEIQMEGNRWWLVMPDGRHYWARYPEEAVEALKRAALGTRDPWE